MAFCQNCGQQFPDGTPQCPNCGMPMMQQPVYQQNPYPNQQQFAPNMNMQQPKKKGKGCLIAIGVFILLAILGSALGNNSNSTPPVNKEIPKEETTQVTTSEAATDKTTTDKNNMAEDTKTQPVQTKAETATRKSEESETTQPPDDIFTLSQKNAISSAKSYIKTMAFSYDGLIDQLEYEQYSHEDAIVGADNCGADWSEEALESAKSYIKTMAYSYSGLIEQLEYEKFTSEQATYGADNCGADWNEEAAQSAKSYLNYSSFSRDELIDQLVYEGFTYEQAEYGAASVGY